MKDKRLPCACAVDADGIVSTRELNDAATHCGEQPILNLVSAFGV